MPRLSEEKINNIYLRCNMAQMSQLLDLCLDPESGITVEGLRAVHYNKIDQLEQLYREQAEEIMWGRSQDSVEALSAFIDNIKRGTFSSAHLAQAKDRMRELTAAQEEQEWSAVRSANDLNLLQAFIKKCTDGIYSEVHLQQAQEAAEEMEWNHVRDSRQAAAVNAFIQKCQSGIYSTRHVAEGRKLLEEWAFAAVADDWQRVSAIADAQVQLNELNLFIQTYGSNPAPTVQNYIAKANAQINRLADAEQARIDWIDAKNVGTILSYVRFLEAHPYCEYREEAEMRVQNMKGDLLNDMTRFPFKYKREDLSAYITTNALTMQDLVDNTNVLTDRAYSHIRRYPHLQDEQRKLPVSQLENPQSEPGNTDVYFFGVGGSGKTCVLSGLMSLTGRLGFRFDPKGPGGGGNYAMELRNYARNSMLPPATDQKYIQVIDAEINDEEGNLRKMAFIEMSGEKTAQFSAMDTPTSFDDLGPGAASLLSNDNSKLIFFVIDPTNEHNVHMGESNDSLWVVQSDVLDCVSALLAKNPDFMKKVVAVHIILTKSDTLGDYVDEHLIMDRLHEQGYAPVLEGIKRICQKYDINKPTGFQPGLYPFCIGKFMPGEVYTFDDTHSLKILRVIQKHVVPRVNQDSFLGKLRGWFNS